MQASHGVGRSILDINDEVSDLAVEVGLVDVPLVAIRIWFIDIWRYVC